MTKLSLFRSLTILLVFLTATVAAHAQASNLLKNPNADDGVAHWRASEEATVEATAGGNFCFVVRNGGQFTQDVEVPEDAAGKYAVLIGRGSSERVNADGTITGLPALYGYMMKPGRPNGGIILEYLQGQQMLGRPYMPGVWVNMSGVFRVPETTKIIRFFLNQAERKGVPHNGSAARFDNLGLYLFATKEEADAFLLSQ